MKWACVGLLLLAGCRELPDIEAEECGNAVLEPAVGEDCDTFTELRGGVCRPPGVIGECRFDCTVTSDGSRGTCPRNMGCAADGICRAYTERFESPKQISTDLSSWLTAANFDGEGGTELISSEPEDQLQQARFRVHYFDADTRLQETRIFPRTTTRPLARRLNDDATDDLVFCNLRVGLLPGQRDRSFLPATFSSYVVDAAELRAVSVSDASVGEETSLGIAVFTTVGDKTGIFVPVRKEAQLDIRDEWNRPVSDLVAPPLAARLVTTTDSPCDEVVFGYRGDDFVSVLDLCELATDPLVVENQWRAEPRRQVVRLPAGSTLQSAPVVADLNADGHLDLLLNDGDDTFFALGDGSQLEPVATRLTLPVEGERDPYRLPNLLAAGDITGDGAADFVIPLGIIGSRKSRIDGSTVYFETFANSSLPWTTAFVGDLNANGLADVVAATEGADGISFVNGSGGPNSLGARITTRGPVRLLTTGDFDGDLIRDIAYIEGRTTGGMDLLAVAYGARDQLPIEPIRVAEVDAVEQLGRQRSLGVDDIFTTSTDRVRGQVRGKFTLFAGDTSRLPFAPYTLVTFPEDGRLVDEVAVAAIVGQFTRSGQNDVLALGTQSPESPWNQWLLPDMVAGIDPPRRLKPGSTLPDTVLTTDFQNGVRLSSAGVAADVDGSGLDEAIWLMPKADGSCVLLVYTVDAGERAVELQSQLPLQAHCGVPQLAAADLNTDGRLDLLTLLGGEGSPRRLQVLWNDGGGGFSLDDRSDITPPSADDVRAFGLFPGDGVQLAIVTSEAAFTATTREDSRRWVVTQVPGERFEDARSVVVADLNGDTFPDMVVADANGLWLAKAELK